MAKDKTEASKPRTEGGGTPVDMAKGLGALVAAIFVGEGGVLTMGPPTDVPVLTHAATIAVSALVWLFAWVVGKRVGRRESHKVFRTRCVTTFVVAGVIVAGATIGYVLARGELSAPCGGERHVVGTELTDRGREMAKRYNSPEELLMTAGCKARDVWTAESLRRSAILLWTSFLLVIGAFVFPVVFLWYVLTSGRLRAA